jgi:hypothetical protein
MGKADKAFSDYIRERDGWKCVTCGAMKEHRYMHCGHYITRGKHNTRFSEENANCQCYSCNIMKMGNKEEYAPYLELLYGYGILQKLQKEGNISKTHTIEELQEIIQIYKDKLVKLLDR